MTLLYSARSMASPKRAWPVASQQPPGEHHAADGGAGLGIGAIGWQLERVAERFAVMASPQRTREVRARGDHVIPAPNHGVQQRRIAGLRRHVHRAAVEVHLAHRVAGHRRSVTHGQVILPVLAAEASASQQPVPALVDEMAGQLQVHGVPGLPVQLHERHLDLGVAVDAGTSAGPQGFSDERHRARGDASAAARRRPSASRRPRPG